MKEKLRYDKQLQKEKKIKLIKGGGAKEEVKVKERDRKMKKREEKSNVLGRKRRKKGGE